MTSYIRGIPYLLIPIALSRFETSTNAFKCSYFIITPFLWNTISVLILSLSTVKPIPTSSLLISFLVYLILVIIVITVTLVLVLCFIYWYCIYVICVCVHAISLYVHVYMYLLLGSTSYRLAFCATHAYLLTKLIIT